MNILEAPKDYTLLTARDYYSHYLSHIAMGIVGALTYDANGVELDYFTSGKITVYKAPTLAEAVAAAEAELAKITGEF